MSCESKMDIFNFGFTFEYLRNFENSKYQFTLSIVLVEKIIIYVVILNVST